MKCSVQRLRQDGCRKKGVLPSVVKGSLSVDELTQSAFGRAVRVARLVDSQRPSAAPEVIPSLFDVSLLQISTDRIVLAGFERITSPEGIRDVMQTWVAEISRE